MTLEAGLAESRIAPIARRSLISPNHEAHLNSSAIQRPTQDMLDRPGYAGLECAGVSAKESELRAAPERDKSTWTVPAERDGRRVRTTAGGSGRLAPPLLVHEAGRGPRGPPRRGPPSPNPATRPGAQADAARRPTPPALSTGDVTAISESIVPRVIPRAERLQRAPDSRGQDVMEA